jgi:hypothetical protein
MADTELAERYLVVSHNRTKKPYRVAGSAYGKKSETYYVLYLRLFPGVPFFVESNHDRSWEYTVFSGRAFKDDGSARFFCQVGTGVYLGDTKSIEVFLPDLRQVYYLRLDSVDLHCELSREAV